MGGGKPRGQSLNRQSTRAASKAKPRARKRILPAVNERDPRQETVEFVDENGLVHRLPKYAAVDEEGRPVTRMGSERLRELTHDELASLALPPPLCQDQKPDWQDPQSCIYKGLAQRLKKPLDTILAAQKQGLSTCVPPKLGPHQRVVFELAGLFATRSQQDLQGHRGLLVYHNTGSGKTMTTLGIILQFWNTSRRIILSSTPDNLRDNSLNKYALNLLVFFPKYAASVFKGQRLPAKPWTFDAQGEAAKWCNNDANIRPLAMRVNTDSFTVLASKLGYSDGLVGRGKAPGPGYVTDGSVLVIDEVQSIFKPEEKYAGAADYLRKFLQTDEARENSIVFGLTATPGSTPQEVLTVVNFIRPVHAPPLTLDSPPEAFAGLISYADIRGDSSKYATMTVRNRKVQASARYFVALASATSKLPDNVERIKSLRTSISKSQIPVGLFTQAELQAKLNGPRVHGIPSAVSVGNTVRLLSEKTMDALRNAVTGPGKQYMYTSSITNAKALAAALEHIGMQRVSTARGADAAMKEPGHRFLLFLDAEDGPGSLSAMLKPFNDKSNIRGEFIKIIVASKTFYQGLDISGLRGVHILEPLFSAAADLQAVGRALRNCGHNDLKPAERNVQVLRYFLEPPPKKEVDGRLTALKGSVARYTALAVNSTLQATNMTNEGLFARAEQEGKPMRDFEKRMQGVALDCTLFRDVFHAQLGVKCVMPHQKWANSLDGGQPFDHTRALQKRANLPRIWNDDNANVARTSSRPQSTRYHSSREFPGHNNRSRANSVRASSTASRGASRAASGAASWADSRVASSRTRGSSFDRAMDRIARRIRDTRLDARPEK